MNVRKAIEGNSEKNWTTLGYKLAALFAALDVVCGAIVYTIPGAAEKALRYLTHSDWQFTIMPFEPTRFTIGIVLWAVIGLATGYIIKKWLCSCCEK